MNKQQKPLNVTIAVISIAFIVYMWVKKDMVSLYAAMPREQLIPVIATTVAVTLIKVLGITGVLLLVKMIVKKLMKKRRSYSTDSTDD